MSSKKKEITSALKSKLKKIKIVLSDVDGVLTDGGMFYSNDGLYLKKFFVKDGMGSYLLKQSGFQVGIITSDHSSINKIRGERLKLDFIYIDVADKKKILDEICSNNNCKYENIAFIGDDVNDLEILKNVGFSASPKDAVIEISKIVDYICKHKGGRGAFREFADLIIANKN